MREPLTRFFSLTLLLQSLGDLLQFGNLCVCCLFLMFQPLYPEVEPVYFPAQLLIPILFSLIIASILLLRCRQFLQLPFHPRLVIPSLLF